MAKHTPFDEQLSCVRAWAHRILKMLACRRSPQMRRVQSRLLRRDPSANPQR